MEDSEIYTITIVHNIGIPISFTIKKKKVIFFLFSLFFIICTLLYGSINYILLKSSEKQLSEELSLTRKKLSLMSDQLTKQNQEQYWKNLKQEDEVSNIKNTLLNQAKFSTEGIWVTNKNTVSLDELQEDTSVELADFKAKITSDDLLLVTRLKNTSNPAQAVGGYICITLVNNDLTPPVYKSVDDEKIGEDGFPVTYKSGRQYYIKNKSHTRTIKQKIRLSEVNEYYTDAMLFIYSYKGSLLNRQTIPIEKAIFLE